VRLILTLEYDGTPFRGWAAQPGLPTVEAALRQALGETFASVESLAVAGRTDTGVHALGQVASVDVEGGPPPERAAAALNPRLPDEITVLSSAEAPDGFHARHSARSRSYRYRIFTRSTPSPFEQRRSWWLPRPLDEDALAAAAASLAGEHDFRAFTPAQTQHEVFVRVVEWAEWIRRGDHLDFVRPRLDLGLTRRWHGADGRVDVELSAGAAAGTLPRQALYLVGGRGTLPGYAFRAYGGDRFATLRTTASAELWAPFVRGRLFAGAAWADVGDSGRGALATWGALPMRAPKYGAGAGVGLFYDILRVDVARGLSTGGRWELIIEANPSFWDFL